MHIAGSDRKSLVWCAAAGALFCCGGANSESGTTALMAGPDDLAPAVGETPFPCDVWLGEDGTLDPIPGLERWFSRGRDDVSRHLEVLDGFGTRPLVEFPLSGALDPSSLPQLTTGFEDAAVVFSIDDEEVVPYEWRLGGDSESVVGSPVPGTVLRSGATYAAVLTTALFDGQGQALAPAPALDELVEVEEGRWASTSMALRRARERMGVDRIAAVTAFTIQRAPAVVLAGRELVGRKGSRAEVQMSFPDPEIVFAGPDALDALFGEATRFDAGPRAGGERWGSANPTGMAHDHVGVVATGTIRLARFRRADGGNPSPESGTFELDDQRRPQLQNFVDIPVSVVLPRAPAPEAGYPVVLLAHGLGSSRHAVVTFAEPLARAGFAIVAIDADGHGSRYSSTDVRNNMRGLIGSDFSGDGTIRDGFGDTTGIKTTFEFLGALRNFSAARDGILQSVLDWSQVALHLRSGDYDLSALATEWEPEPRFDTHRLAFLGESFGTIVGGVLAAIEPEIELFILDVPGAGVVDLAIVDSPALASLLLPLADSLYGLKGRLDRFRPAVHLLQSLVDAADPLTYGPHLLGAGLPLSGERIKPRHVVALEVVGDEAIHNEATDAWARSIGLEVLTPHLSIPDGMSAVESPAGGNVAGHTAVIVQYSPAAHGTNWASEVGRLEYVPGFPHAGVEPFPRLDEPRIIENPIYETLEQVVGILESYQADGVPTVVSSHVPEEL